MKIIVSYRGIPGRPGWATGDCLCRAFTALGHHAVPYGNIYGTDEWMGRDCDGDLLVMLECNDADRGYLHLSDIQTKKIFWVFDSAMRIHHYLDYIDHFDFHRVFGANRLDCLTHGWTYLPYAVDPGLFYPSSEPRSGVALIGTPFPERFNFVMASGIMGVYGLFGQNYARTLAGMAINVHHFASGGNGLLVCRVWEALGSRTCLLTDRDPVLLEHFTDGQHLVTFDSPDECRQVVSRLLGDSEACNAIAQAGYDEVMRNHTYLERAKTILASVG